MTPVSQKHHLAQLGATVYPFISMPVAGLLFLKLSFLRTVTRSFNRQWLQPCTEVCQLGSSDGPCTTNPAPKALLMELGRWFCGYENFSFRGPRFNPILESSRSRGSSALFWPPRVLLAHSAHRDKQTQTHIHKQIQPSVSYPSHTPLSLHP